MTLPIKETIVLSELDSLEYKAEQHYKAAMREWHHFVMTCQQIQDSNLWREKANTWELYASKYLPVGASRIRQYKSALPYAELLEQSTGFAPSENQVRALREVVSDESKLIEVFRQAASLYEGEPAKRHFEAINDVLEQVETKNAVTVDGKSVSVTALTVTAAMQEACQEADLRFAEHRRKGNGTPIKIMAQRVGEFWQLKTDSQLPENFEFTFYVYAT